ncbi:MAG: hypothetical protein COC19_00025 [SAR86 cluster bacterium]|uniref:Tetratricopeptide repeat-like domain-containing protein n=1 Tax=SAR86 cluster bacterium TaxID=2030880 RepID=A0A2A4MWI6_9GAMM|nr:MAG: hypothetical protein COC19_00025 [SAR86 cluster bacterium]
MNSLSHKLLLCLITSALLGCVSNQAEFEDAQSDEQLMQTAQPNPGEQETIEYGHFTEEQLYQTIISELGAQRGVLDQAGDRYFKLAMETKDPSIIQRAIQFASVNNDVQALTELGLLWVEIAPDTTAAHLMLSYQLLESGLFEQALGHMIQIIELGGQFDFTALSARTTQVDTATREALIASLRTLSLSHPSQRSLKLSLVRLLDQNQQTQQGLAVLQTLIKTEGDDPQLAVVNAQLLQKLDRGNEAIKSLKKSVRSNPDNSALRFSYARLLIQNDELAQARQQFETLIINNPTDYETLYSIALLNLEMEDFEAASSAFTRLISANQRVDESHFYLGYIAEQGSHLEQAISHYRNVRIGTSNFLAAQQQATRFAIELDQLESAHRWLSQLSQGQPRLEVLFTTIESSALIQAGHLVPAQQLLTQAIETHPLDTDLLFARVLLYDRIKDPVSAEADLRRIISLEPDDSRALNHLGYMLADQTTRFDEALELLELAIAISPDDPAIIDSLAWVQYKLGRYEQAAANLRRAFAVFPDPEVASHLGEVLWTLGKQEEASQIWNNALQDTPDSELLKNVMERFIP